MKSVLYLLALGVFGIATTEFGVIGVLPQLASVFHVSIDKAGWLLSGFAIIIALFAPFMMLLFGSYDRKKLLLLALAAFIVSNIVSAFAVNFNMLLLARVLPAFLHPVFWSVALATAANAVPAEQAPAAAGVVFGGFTVASVLGIPLATYAADLFSWQASFILSAIINAASFLGLLFFLPPIPAAKKTEGAQIKILGKKEWWMGLLLAFLLVTAMYATYGYMAAYLQDVTHMNGAQTSLMLLIFGITGVAGNWLAGKSLNRNIKTTTLVFIISMIAVHLLLYFFGFLFLPMVLIVFLWGFVHTGGFLISNVNVTSAAGGASEFVNSIFTSCGNLAVTAGSAIGGLTIARIGITSLTWTSIVLLLLSLVTLLVKKQVIGDK